MYWIWQGSMGKDKQAKELNIGMRLFRFIENRENGLKELHNELGWKGGTIWQVLGVLYKHNDNL